MRTVFGAVIFIALLLATALHAQSIATGAIVDKIVAASDPEMTYAAYLPAFYSAERRWPVIFVMDPRRRGAFAAELFRDAAEQFGWIIISSNNTESDNENAPNERSLRAMLIDSESRFSIDEHRIYFAGFSGTANFAFFTAEKLAVAGVIGCSGWLAPAFKAHDPGFPWFGTAGDTDFNYPETKSIDDRLAAGGAAHRFESFAGPHRWAPKELLVDAVAWMELQAMKRRTRDTDAALVAKLLARDVAAAQGETDPLRAMRRYELQPRCAIHRKARAPSPRSEVRSRSRTATAIGCRAFTTRSSGTMTFPPPLLSLNSSASRSCRSSGRNRRDAVRLRSAWSNRSTCRRRFICRNRCTDRS